MNASRTAALALPLCVVLLGCSAEVQPIRPFPTQASVGPELAEQEALVTEAFEIWDSTFACEHTVSGLSTPGDVELDPSAGSAGRFSHPEGRIYLGQEAIDRGAVVTTVLHELGHAHMARHVAVDGSLMAEEVAPGNVIIDSAMEESVCRGDPSCCAR